jgi:hypothetical protein
MIPARPSIWHFFAAGADAVNAPDGEREGNSAPAAALAASAAQNARGRASLCVTRTPRDSVGANYDQTRREAIPKNLPPRILSQKPVSEARNENLPQNVATIPPIDACPFGCDLPAQV